jgi:hypothetical protein
VKLSFLDYHSPSALDIYPTTPDILWLPQSVLTRNTPNVVGCIYTLICEETNLTAERSKTHI